MNLPDYNIRERLRDSPFPGELFHYTSAAALHAVLTTRTLHASDQNHLNDANEFQHTLDLVRESLRLRLLDTHLSFGLRTFIDRLDTGLNRIESHVFVFSLSEDPDLLSQWRGFVRPEVGFRLGLKVRRLSTWLKPLASSLAHASTILNCKRGLLKMLSSP
jgi:hypothetical protein